MLSVFQSESFSNVLRFSSHVNVLPPAPAKVYIHLAAWFPLCPDFTIPESSFIIINHYSSGALLRPFLKFSTPLLLMYYIRQTKVLASSPRLISAAWTYSLPRLAFVFQVARLLSVCMKRYTALPHHACSFSTSFRRQTFRM